MLDQTLKMSEKLRNPEEASQPAMKHKFSPTAYVMEWESAATSNSAVK